MSITEVEPVEGVQALENDPITEIGNYLLVSECILREEGAREFVKSAIEWREAAVESMGERNKLPPNIPSLYPQHYFEDIGEAYRYYLPLAANVAISIHGAQSDRIVEANRELAGMLLELWGNRKRKIPGDTRVEAYLTAQLIDRRTDIKPKDLLQPAEQWKSTLASARAVIRRIETQMTVQGKGQKANVVRVGGLTRSGHNINDANCRKSNVDPLIFFPESTRKNAMQKKVKEAKEICKGCVVKEDCLERALGFDENDGIKEAIYGGTTKAERRKIRADRRETLRKEAEERKAKEAAAAKAAAELAKIEAESQSTEVEV